MIMDETLSVRNFFASYHIQLSTEWLQSCINWCKEEILLPNYTLQELQFKVYEQWLLLDLRDVEIPCLPPDLSQKIKYILNGNYALQMMKVIDISKPKHWQLQRIRNGISKNIDEEVQASNRVLQLTLTDGVQEIEAMEYKLISSLHLNLCPGIKILLKGPITVRRGRLILETHNIKVLGGEVEDLIVSNAAENILAKILNLPLNETPKVIEENLLSANKDMFSHKQGISTRNVSQNQTNTRINLTNERPTTNANNQQVSNNQQNRVSNQQNQTYNQIESCSTITNPVRLGNTDFTDEEERKIAEEIDMIMEVSREFEQSNKRPKTPDMFDSELHDSDFENIDIPETVIKTSNELNRPSCSNEKNIKLSETKVEEVIDLSESLEMENEIFENIDIDKIDKEQGRISTPQKPAIFTIEKLTKNIPNISNGKFKIRAKFKSIVEKLTITDDGFHLVVEVEDESGSITVKFHSDVVADLAGCCLEALLSLKMGVQEQNAEAQRKILETIKRIKEKLLQLNNVIEIHINVKETHPVVVKIL